MSGLYLGAIAAEASPSLQGGTDYYADVIIAPYVASRGGAIQEDHGAPLFAGENAHHPVFNSEYLERPVVQGTKVMVGAELTAAENPADQALELSLAMSDGRPIGIPVYPAGKAGDVSAAEAAALERALDERLSGELAFNSLRLTLDAPNNPDRRGTLHGVGTGPDQYTVLPFTRDGVLLMAVAVMSAFKLIPKPE